MNLVQSGNWGVTRNLISSRVFACAYAHFLSYDVLRVFLEIGLYDIDV